MRSSPKIIWILKNLHNSLEQENLDREIKNVVKQQTSYSRKHYVEKAETCRVISTSRKLIMTYLSKSILSEQILGRIKQVTGVSFLLTKSVLKLKTGI